jgi:hypothetical protein
VEQLLHPLCASSEVLYSLSLLESIIRRRIIPNSFMLPTFALRQCSLCTLFGLKYVFEKVIVTLQVGLFEVSAGDELGPVAYTVTLRLSKSNTTAVKLSTGN